MQKHSLVGGLASPFGVPSAAREHFSKVCISGERRLWNLEASVRRT